jgi:hypothetical protein
MDGSFGQRYGIDATSAVPVRPDGPVAFRMQCPPADPTHELTGVLTQILAR